MADWRNDESWRLVSANEGVAVTDKPSPKAELANDPCWASLYGEDGRSIVATWIRTLGVPEKEREAMERRARARRDAERAKG